MDQRYIGECIHVFLFRVKPYIFFLNKPNMEYTLKKGEQIGGNI